MNANGSTALELARIFEKHDVIEFLEQEQSEEEDEPIPPAKVETETSVQMSPREHVGTQWPPRVRR